MIDRAVHGASLDVEADGDGAFVLGVLVCEHVECRHGDDTITGALEAIDHADTRHEVLVERAFLAELGSGCSLPIGAHADSGRLFTFLADFDSGITVSDTIDGSSGAKGFAFCGGVENVKVELTFDPAGFNDFAVGEFGIAN